MRPHPYNQARRRSQMRPHPFPTGQANAGISDMEKVGASGPVSCRTQPHPCPVGPALAQVREGDRMRSAPGP